MYISARYFLLCLYSCIIHAFGEKHLHAGKVLKCLDPNPNPYPNPNPNPHHWNSRNQNLKLTVAKGTNDHESITVK